MRRIGTAMALPAVVLSAWLICSAQQPATKMPAGVKVAVAAVEETRRKAFVGKPRGGAPAGLKLTINVTGTLPAKALRYGFVTVGEAVDDKGNGLAKTKTIFDRRQREGFVTIGSWKRSGVKDGFQFELYLAETKRQASKLARLTGSLKLLTGRKTVEVVVKDVKGLTGKAVDDASLTAAGLKLKVVETKAGFMSDPARQVSFTLTGNEHAILGMTLVDAAGKRIRTSHGWSSSRTGPKVHFLSTMKKLPEKVALKLTVLMGAKATTVPLALKDIPLP